MFTANISFSAKISFPKYKKPDSEAVYIHLHAPRHSIKMKFRTKESNAISVKGSSQDSNKWNKKILVNSVNQKMLYF